MADTSWEYIIPGKGIYNDTSQNFEPVVPGVGTVLEGESAVGANAPTGVFYGPFVGPLGGPI